MVLYSQGKYAPAEQSFRRAVQLSPKTAVYHSNLADCFYNTERYDEAIAEYQEAVRLAPNESDYKTRLQNAVKKKNGK